MQVNRRGLPHNASQQLCDVRRALAPLVFGRCGVSLPNPARIEVSHFLNALQICQSDPAKAARIDETLRYLERARRDFPRFSRVRASTKGFHEAKDPAPGQPDVQKYSSNKRAFIRTCAWVTNNLTTLLGLHMHKALQH